MQNKRTHAVYARILDATAGMIVILVRIAIAGLFVILLFFVDLHVIVVTFSSRNNTQGNSCVCLSVLNI